MKQDAYLILQMVAEADRALSRWADYVSRDAFMVGRRYENIQVRALRNLSNPDGSTRREIDVTSDVVYRDGTASRQVPATLISGSSAGTPRCTTPRSSATPWATPTRTPPARPSTR